MKTIILNDITFEHQLTRNQINGRFSNAATSRSPKHDFLRPFRFSGSSEESCHSFAKLEREKALACAGVIKFWTVTGVPGTATCQSGGPNAQIDGQSAQKYFYDWSLFRRLVLTFER